MSRVSVVRRLALGLAATAMVCATCGCVSYWKHRAQDAMEFGDIGFTVTKTPQLGAYADGVSVASGGYAKINGHFVGYGGGRFGITPHYTHDVGLVGCLTRRGDRASTSPISRP